MANLNIKVNVDVSEADKLDKIASSLKKKLEAVEIDIGKGAIESLQKSIAKIDSKESIDIKVNTDQAVKQLNSLESEFTSLKAKLEDSFNLNFKLEDTFGKFSADDIVKDFKKSFSGIDDSLFENFRKAQEGYKQSAINTFKDMDIDFKVSDTLKKQQSEINKMTKEFDRETKSRIDDFKTQVNQYKSLAKDLAQMQTKYDSGDLTGNQMKNLEQQITRVKSVMEDLRSSMKIEAGDMGLDFKDFGGSADEYFNSIVQGSAKAQQEMKEFAQSITESKEAMKEITKLENERSRAVKDSQNKSVGENEAKYLQDRAQALEKEISIRKELEAFQNASANDRNQFAQLENSNRALEEQIQLRKQAQQADEQAKARIKEQAEAYSALNKEIKSMNKAQQEVAKLQTRQDEGIATTANLEKLEKQKVLLDSYRKSVEDMQNSIKTSGLQNDTFDKQAQSLKEAGQAAAELESRMEQAGVAVKKQEANYKDIEASMKRQHQYAKQMISAEESGNRNTAQEYARLMQYEEQYQAQIRQRGNISEQANRQMFGDQADEYRRLEESHRRLTQARSADGSSSGFWGDYKSKFGTDSIYATIDVMDVIREVSNQVRQSFDSFSELDSALVNVRKVVEATDSEFQGFTDTIFDNASAVGKTASEYTVSVERWASAGKSLAESQELARLSTMGAFVGNIDEAAMVDYMSVPLNAFSSAGLEAQDILNAMNEVANKNAIEMNDLGIAYQRASATAAASGTSFAELTGLITAAQEATRLGGQTIGTAFRSMDVNFGKMFTGITKQDSKRTEFFEGLGVNIKDSNGELRSTYDILQDLSSAWGGLTDQQKQQATYYAAGKQYSNILASLMNNWSKVEEVVGQAQGQLGLPEGVGSAFDEFASQTDSIEYKLNTLKNSWLEFQNTLLGGDGREFFKGALDNMNDFMEVANKLVGNKEFMSWAGELTKGLGMLFMGDFMGTGISKFGKMFTKNFKGIGDAVKLANGPLGKFGAVLKGTLFSGGISALPFKLAAIATGFSILDKALYSLTGGRIDMSGWMKDNILMPVRDSLFPTIKEFERFQSAYDNFTNLKAEHSNIQQQVSEYESLRAKLQETREEREALYEETGNFSDLALSEEEFTDLQTQHNEFIEGLDLEADLEIRFNNYDHIMSQMDAVEARIKGMEYDSRVATVEAGYEVQDSITESSTYNRYGEYRKTISGLQSDLVEYQKELKNWQDIYDDPNADPLSRIQAESQIQGLKTQIDEVTRSLGVAQQELDNFLSSNTGNILSDSENKAFKDATRDVRENLIGALNEGIGQGQGTQFINDILGSGKGNLSSYFDTLQFLSEANSNVDTLNSGIDTTKSLIGSVKDGTREASDVSQELNEAWNEVLTTFGEDKSLQNWMNANGVDGIESFFDEEGIFQQDLFDNFIQQMETAKTKYEQQVEDMKEATLDLAEQFNLSADQAQAMMDKFTSGDMSGYIKDVFDADKSIGNEQAYMHLGVGVNESLVFEDISLKLNMDSGDVMADLQSQVDGLDGELALEYDLKLESGVANFDELSAYLGEIETFRNTVGAEPLIQAGLIDASTGMPQLEEMLALVDGIKTNAKGLSDIGIDIEQGTGIEMFTQLMEQWQNEEIDIKVNATGDGLDITNLETGETIEVPLVPETSEIEAFYNKPPETVNVKYNMDFSSDEFSNNWFSDMVIQDTELVQDVEVQARYQLSDGSMDMDAIWAEAVGNIEQSDIEAMANVSTRINWDVEGGEDLNIDHITNYIAVLLKDGNATEAMEFVQKVFPMLEFEGDSLSGDAIDQAINELKLDIEGSGPISTEHELEPEIAGGAGAVENAVNEAIPDEVDGGSTTAIIDIAMEENLIQDNLSGISDILGRDYSINIDTNVDDGGLSQIKAELENLPPDKQIAVLAEVMGVEDASQISEIIAGLPPSTVVQAILQATGQETLQGALVALQEFDGSNATATTNVVKSGEVEPIEDTESEHLINVAVSNPESIMALNGQDISFTVTANMTDHVSSRIAIINSELSSLPSNKTIEISVSSDGANSIQSIIDSMNSMQTAQTATITVTANTSSAQSAINQVNMSLMSLSMKVVTVRINGDNSGYMSAANAVINHFIPPKQVAITANAAPFYNTVNSLSVSRTVTVTVNAKVNKSNAVAIGNDLSTAFSQSIGSNFSTGIRSGSVGVNRNYSSTDDEKTVNEDVWRYWAKEMYTGTPLENTMDELNSQLKRVDGNFQEMIRIYRQQIQVTREQIQFEKDMAKLRQNEMNSILQELRGLGFKTDGNRITNLDFAKGLSGDTATDADKLLTDWKSLYESITGLNSSISRLESQIFEIEKDIEQARMDEELERLENRLSKTDLLISALNNHLDILNTKDSLISDLDYELKIAVSEENIDTSVSNIQRLIREFNELSMTSVEFSENAEVVYDRLEELSDEIVANADNIIKFREQINQIRIDALADDFDRFTEAVNRNADSISNNVSILREGLVSGSGLSELGPIFDVDFSRSSALDKVYADRLRLEANLDNALEQYAKSQIQRTITTSKAQLQIAEGTYKALASISQGQSYSGGYFMDAEKSFGIGLTNAKLAISEFDRYQVKMLDFMDEYQAQYQKIASIYELSMKSAVTYSDKQQAQMEMILSQLALQEKFQTKAIAQYQEAIRLAQEQLEDESLTTDQRRELLELIDKYKGNISDAQKVIREAIAERYDYEFEMMDKLAEKGQKYYDSISHLIDVGNLVNLSPDAMQPFYEALYGASIYQYQLAKEQLAELNKEQRRFEEGSYEWNLLGEKIEEINESVKELGINALEANRSILENTLNALETQFEKGFLNDKTLDQWKDYYDNWLDGIDKELKLEELRLKALGLESNLINSRLEALDRQEAVSQKDVEYMDKQLKVLELQNKLRNIEGERNVQVLTRREDGSWGFEYQADQSEYEDTQKDLNEAERELAEYRRQQRGAYVSDLGDIIERARNGEYASSDDLQADLTRLNSVYGYVLDDLPGFEFMNLDQITEAYQKYLKENNLIATDLTGGMSPDNTAIQQQSAVFAQSFLNISTDLGNIIGQELRRTLGMVEGQSFITPNHIYQIGTLSLPNVTDGDGLVRIFEELPKVTEQEVYSK